MIGKTISHYKILEKLGQGGMGVVYRAEDTKLKRLVALKFLPQDLTQDQEATKRFIYEAQTASALDHLNVCTIHEIDEIDDSRLFISMAYYEGETLKQKIARGPLPIEEAVDITIQIAQGLAKAHEKGIIHRDIKPANIIVQRDGSVKIIDFGLSKLMRDQSITKSGSTLGTVAYMSEEQALGKKVDHRSDIWSLGVVLYEMLTGQQPFKGEYEQTVIYNIINKDPKPIKELRPEIPQELQEIVKRTLNKKPDSRFSSVAEMLEKLREYPLALKPVGAELFGIKPLLKSFKQPRVALPAILILTIVMFFAIQFFIKNSHARWARYEALPEAARLLLQEQNLVDAFLLAQQAQRYIPDDPQAEKLLNSASYPRVLRTTPSGADVYFKDYFAVGAEWHYIGRTPIDSTRLPVSYLRIRVTRKGFETAICAVNIWMTDTLQFKLTPKGTAPPGMVLVPGGRQQLGSDDPVELQEYWLDKYEVTNKQYKKFVDAGGYQMLDYWKHPFVRKGRTLSWEQAMTEFRDVTGRPGPSTWKLGTYPDGQAEYPVRGVSWYEAAAYAEFAGKSLPTVYHWRKAAGLVVFTNILSLSNFDNEGSAPAGTYQGLSPCGSYDMAGNVKEWCLNETTGKRYILGGAWNEPEYMFSARDAQRPFGRAETYGFRCARYPDPLSEELTRPIAALYHDFSQEKPVKDDIFEIYENLYSYDPINLDARIEGVDESPEHWRKETVSFNAAYGEERMLAHLYLPKNAAPPYQVVIYFPGINALNISVSENLADMAFVDFIPRCGRAFLYPVYKGTYERGGGKPARGPRAFRNRTIQRGKDIQRSIDYLESREDIDTEKIAYFGMSWGAFEGPIFTAIEKRFKVSILLGGGFYTNLFLSGALYYDFMRREAEVNPIHFAPRSRLPVLMINGRYDFMFPVATSIVPMFRLQGAPEKDKRLALFDYGHLPPLNEVIRETLDWLDHHLGAVQSEMQNIK